MCQSLDSWREIEEKHTQGSQIQTSALNRETTSHELYVISHSLILIENEDRNTYTFTVFGVR